MNWKVRCPKCGSQNVGFWEAYSHERSRSEAHARCHECGWRSEEVFGANCRESFGKLEDALTPKQPRTIIDKLRSMTDEEIAGTLAGTPIDSICALCEDKHGPCDAIDNLNQSGAHRCAERILAYLQTPLTDEKEENEMSVKLKSCPFCGATSIDYAGGVRPYVRCGRCGATIESSTPEGGETAFSKWNTRAGGMTINEYQRLAQRTSSDDPGVFATIEAKKIDNGILGMAGEAGECADLLKKSRHQGHTFDVDEVVKECGDVLWYAAELAAGLGLTLEEIARRNIEKLEKRYPKGHFEAERSINREGE